MNLLCTISIICKIAVTIVILQAARREIAQFSCTLQSAIAAPRLNFLKNVHHDIFSATPQLLIMIQDAGVISRGLRGAEPPLLKFLLILRGSAPLEFLHWLSFSEFIRLASEVL